MPNRPTYRGRPLPRPDEELVDQGLGFDLGTLLGRRRALAVLGLGAVALGAAACGASSSDAKAATSGSSGPTEIPDEIAGPYPGDGSNGPDVLNQSGIVRSDIRSSFGTATGTAAGVLMTLELKIVDLANAGAPFKNVAVYVWHCVQLADDTGTVRFTSIFPGCYAGRWPHVHFEVYPDQASITDATKAIATSQVALPKATCTTVYAQTGYQQSVTNLAGVTLENDFVFGNDDGVHQLGTVTGSVDKGYAVSLTVPVDTRTKPSGGQVPGGAPPSGLAPGGGPPIGARTGPPPSGVPSGAPSTP
jgi:protocatechuate 3,4-dioxygenase beta subunit